jgi:hypothetical protein
MIMFEQSRRLSEPLQWGRREKTVVAVLLGCAVLALAGLGAYSLRGRPAAGKDCVSLTFASTLGGALIHQCGKQARALCATPNPSSEFAQQLREQCRRLGFPLAGG